MTEYDVLLGLYTKLEIQIKNMPAYSESLKEIKLETFRVLNLTMDRHIKTMTEMVELLGRQNNN